MSYTIIRDSQEKAGAWYWEEDQIFAGTKIQSMKTGDYTIEGLEHLLTIERKRTVSEIAHNLHEPRFDRVLDRMTEFPYRFLVFEFSFNDVLVYPKGVDLPPSIKNKIQVNGPYLNKRFTEIMFKYNIPIIYAGDRSNAMKFAYSAFKWVINAQKTNT